jgi:hypothetical protein
MTTLPASLALLHCIAQQCEVVAPVFTPKTHQHRTLKDWIKTEQGFGESVSLRQSEQHVRYIQTLMLIVLSMYGGILIPPIKQFSNTDDRIRILWDSHVVDEFKLGVWDDHFLRFSQYFQNRLSEKPTHCKEIYPVLLKGFQQYLQSYQVILDAVDQRLCHIIGNKLKLMTVLDNEYDRDLVFILLSSLPSEQINALFMYIQSFFPDDLTYKTESGNTVNVIAMFQTPATDILYLIEKTKLYMELYYDNKLPIIKEITRSKTTEFMKKLMQNDQFFHATQHHLKTLQTIQVDTRKKLYTFIDRHLSQVMKVNTNV